jgi:4-amino-4-deoxy-L-arabinose transferase
MGACFLCLYILPLHVRPLAIPDEVRYAEISREMVASGDWIVPRLNGLHYFEKPVMGYWLNGLAMKLFGQNNFSVRITSAISAGLSALMVFFLSAGFSRSTRKGGMAAGIYLTCFLVYGLGVFSVLDGMFSFFLTGCIGSYFLAWSYRSRPPAFRRYLIISGIFCGFAFLTKGFLAFVLPVSVIVPFLIWQKNYSLILRSWWIPAVTALVVIMPWALLVHSKAPDFWHFFFWNEHVKRFFTDGAQHKEPFFFFFMVLPAALMPWTFLVPASISGLREAGMKAPLLRYAVCWFLFPFLLFSISSGKLSTYILPCFPALAILLSEGLSEYLTTPEKRLFDKGVFALMGFVGLLMAALIVLQSGMIDSLQLYAYADPWKGGLFFLVLLIFILVLKKSLTTLDHTHKILWVAAAPLCLYLAAHFLVPDMTLARKCPGNLLKRNITRIDATTPIFSTESPVRAVNWFFQRDDVFVLGAGELRYGLNQADGTGRLVTHEQFYDFIEKNKERQQVAFIVDQYDYQSMKDHLPVPSYIDSTGNNGFAFILYSPR